MSAQNLYPEGDGRSPDEDHVSPGLVLAPDQGESDWDIRATSMYERFGKRPLDFIGAGILLVATSPIIAGTAAAIRIKMGPGVMFRQKRVGRGSAPFTIIKFRTMGHDRRQSETETFNGEDRRNSHKTTSDPRHTDLGRFIRRYGLDELPQLWNVLKGDMSLVGPRPEMYGVAVQHQTLNHVRHRVRPGITGPWQLSADRHRFIHENLTHDEQYVEKVTLTGDVRLLFKTLQLFRQGDGS